MTSSVGKALYKYLAKGKTPSAVAQKLLARNLKKQEVFLDVCRFLYLTGQNRLLMKTALQRLKNKEPVPWAFLLDVLIHQKIPISKETEHLFIKGIEEQKQTPAILSFVAWDFTHPMLKDLKQKEIEKINKKNNAKFIQLMEDLHFIQAQGIFTKEEAILKELKTSYPENPHVHELWLEFREKWGRHLIQKKKKALLKKKLAPASPSETEKSQAGKIHKAILKNLKKDSQSLYDMALLFAFLGWPQKALEILKTQPLSSKAKWLYLELLLESRLYVECLHFLDEIGQQKKEDPEAIFALSYARARAYRGLGKKETAYKILSELKAVRPHYRLTHCLLTQWSKEEL